MPEQDRTSKRAAASETETDGPAANPKVVEKGAALKKSIDDVLDEIDDVLEENAEEFVKSYVQRGGE